MSCQNAVTLESAHQLMRTVTSNPKFSGGVDTADMLEDVLDGIGFGGLWRSSTFHIPNEHERQCTALTDRLIEVSSCIKASRILTNNFFTVDYCLKVPEEEGQWGFGCMKYSYLFLCLTTYDIHLN